MINHTKIWERLFDSCRTADGSGVDLRAVLYEAKKLAEQGDVEAQYYLGGCYRQGAWGVKLDFRRADYWLSKAAAQGGEIGDSAKEYLDLLRKNEKYDVVIKIKERNE